MPSIVYKQKGSGEMFVVSKVRENILKAIVALLCIALIYIIPGVLAWVVVWCRPLLSPTISQMLGSEVRSGTWLDEPLRVIWPLYLFSLVVLVFVLFAVCVASFSSSYEKRKRLLEEINKDLVKLAVLSKKDGSISYTTSGRYGPSTTKIINIGSGVFLIKRIGVNAFGTPVSSFSFFEVGDKYFKSSYGASAVQMGLIRADLSMAKEYGVPNVKMKRIPLGKRLMVRNSNKG